MVAGEVERKFLLTTTDELSLQEIGDNALVLAILREILTQGPPAVPLRSPEISETGPGKELVVLEIEAQVDEVVDAIIIEDSEDQE